MSRTGRRSAHRPFPALLRWSPRQQGPDTDRCPSRAMGWAGSGGWPSSSWSGSPDRSATCRGPASQDRRRGRHPWHRPVGDRSQI